MEIYKRRLKCCCAFIIHLYKKYQVLSYKVPKSIYKSTFAQVVCIPGIYTNISKIYYLNLRGDY